MTRRWGRRSRKRGHWRAPRAASQHRAGSTSGLRWLGLTLVITPPWPSRSWALPVLRGPAPPPAVRQRWGLRHKSIPQWVRQRILVGRRWLPGIARTVMGEHTNSVLDRGNACPRRGVRWIAPLRLAAALYEPAPPRAPGTHGRPRGKGQRAPTLAQGLREAHPT
jgi:hypothetical protein